MRHPPEPTATRAIAEHSAIPSTLYFQLSTHSSADAVRRAIEASRLEAHQPPGLRLRSDGDALRTEKVAIPLQPRSGDAIHIFSNRRSNAPDPAPPHRQLSH